MSMKRFACSALALLLMLGCLDPAAKKSGKERKIRVLLTVGGHPFDEKPFYAIFEAMPDVQWTKIELPREAERLKPGVERDFDVIVMYDMVGDVAPEQRKAFVELLNQGIGIVSLHHNVCSRSDWPEFRKIIGGKYSERTGHHRRRVVQGIGLCSARAVEGPPGGQRTSDHQGRARFPDDGRTLRGGALFGHRSVGPGRR